MIQPGMRLQYEEQETADAYRSLALEPDTQGYVPAQQESMFRRNEVVTKRQSAPTRHHIGETLCVAAGLLIVGAIFQVLIRYVTSVMAVTLMPFPVTLGTSMRAVSFLLTGFAAIIIGVGVGLLANRRTMVTSLVAANALNTLLGIIVAFVYIYMVSPNAIWQYLTNIPTGSLFNLITVAFTEVAVALYVAQKFCKRD